MNTKKYELGSLSDGIANMPRRLTRRERLADHVFFFLEAASWFAFIIGAFVGYAVKGWIGCISLLAVGWLFGMWMRRSLGQRGPDPFSGFYCRIGERARGSRRGALEWLIETLRGSCFSRSQCQRMIASYERAISQCESASSPEQVQRIFQQLDVETKRISYERNP